MFLGRYGDSWVEPHELFDPADAAGPPNDAWDVQLRIPVSLSLLLDDTARGRRDRELLGWWSGLHSITVDMRREAQRFLGYVADGARRGSAPARLRITTVADIAIPGIDTARPHVHVYLGSVGESLLDGTVWPLDEEWLWRWAQGSLYHTFRRAVEDLASDVLGVTIDEPRAGANAEVIDPPWHERIGEAERGVCPGRWGPRRLLLADEESLRAGRENAQLIAEERASGRYVEPVVALLEEDEATPDAAAG